MELEVAVMVTAVALATSPIAKPMLVVVVPLVTEVPVMEAVAVVPVHVAAARIIVEPSEK
jgi:hypothetical protein